MPQTPLGELIDPLAGIKGNASWQDGDGGGKRRSNCGQRKTRGGGREGEKRGGRGIVP